MKKVLALLALLLVSSSALADGTWSVHGWNLASQDLSVGFLAQIFGTMGNVLHGTSGQLLGHMFEVFNDGVLVVAGIWLAYTTITIVLRSSQEGSFMGANRNIATVLLRIALGIALAVPNPSTGYTILQDLVMKVVVEGVGLADHTWSAALGYLKNGGAVYVAPTNIGYNTTAGKKLIQTSNQIFTNEVCMLQSEYVSNQRNKLNESSNNGTSPYVNNPSTTADQQFNVSFDAANNTATFPGLNRAGAYSANACGVVKGTGGVEGKDAAAISASFLATRQLVTSIMPAAERYQCVTSEKGTTNCLGFSTDSWTSDNAETLVTGMYAYYNLIQPYARITQKKVNSKAVEFVAAAQQTGWMLAGRYYWDMANLDKGYSALSISNDMPEVTTPSNIDTSSVKPQVDNASSPQNQFLGASVLELSQALTSIANQSGSNEKGLSQQESNSNGYSGTHGGRDWGNGPNSPISQAECEANPVACAKNRYNQLTNPKGMWNKYGPTNTTHYIKNNIDNSYNDLKSGNVSGFIKNTLGGALGFHGPTIKDLKKDVQKIVSGILGPIAQLIQAFNYPSVNPVQFLMHIGQLSLDVVGELWVGGLMALLGMAFAMGYCNIATDGGSFSAMMAFIKPLMVGVATLLLVPGVILAYYLPLYPFILFSFGAVGWIILVIEAIVAAPLVAFGLTHPEGHDFLGKAEQGLMLVLNVFLRPSLMIIGLVAAMLVSFVAFRLMIYGFVGVMHDVFGGNGGNMQVGKVIISASQLGNVTGSLGSLSRQVVDGILVPVLMTIFSMIIYTVTKYSFSLIHMLPDNIMTWIGHSQKSDGSQQMVEQIQGVASSASRAAGDTMGGMIEAGANLGQRKTLEGQEKGKSKSGGSGGVDVTTL